MIYFILFLIIFSFIVSIILSKITVDVKKMKVNYDESICVLIKNHKVFDFEIDIKIGIFEFFSILLLKITPQYLYVGKLKINYKYINNFFNKINFEFDPLNLISVFFNILNKKNRYKLKYDIKLIDLKMKVGTKSQNLTSIVVISFSTFISLIFHKYIEKFDINLHNYQIEPVYLSRNYYEIDFEFIIVLKSVDVLKLIRTYKIFYKLRMK